MPKKIVDTRHARSLKYRKVLEEIEKKGKCPFCLQNFKYHPSKVLKKKNGWFITENGYSYKDAEHKFLIICEKHKTELKELTAKDLISVKYLADWAVKKFLIQGGALALRFGATNYTGATVQHLHFHLISPKLKRNLTAKTVSFPIG